MGVRERREREKAETRQLIIDTARELFARMGVEAVSMRKIADAIEYSATAIYVHFPDKKTLLHEICRHDYEALGASFQRIGKVVDPVERIRLAGIAYIRFGIKHPNHYRMMFMTPLDPADISEMPTEGMDDPSRDGYAFLRFAVAEAHAQGAFRDEVSDVDLLCQTFWAGVHGVASLSITHHEDPCIAWRGLERRMNAMVDGLLIGLCKPGRYKAGHS